MKKDCIIFDIDSTVANITPRLQTAAVLKKKFNVEKHQFLADPDIMEINDTVIKGARKFINNCKKTKPNLQIIYVSGRWDVTGTYQKNTKKWLLKNNFPVDGVYIRTRKVKEDPLDFKKRINKKLNNKYNVLCSIGDDYKTKDSRAAEYIKVPFISVKVDKWRPKLRNYSELMKLLKK
jgi:predicted secreted acid phosphatase